jgi:hypothetical protein
VFLTATYCQNVSQKSGNRDRSRDQAATGWTNAHSEDMNDDQDFAEIRDIHSSKQPGQPQAMKLQFNHEESRAEAVVDSSAEQAQGFSISSPVGVK